MISSNTPIESRTAVPEATEDLEGFDNTVRQDAGSLARAAELSARNIDPPSSIAGYAITRLLGEGAYGSVWLATERNTGKQVAIKFYSHRRGLDWSLLNREVEKLAVLYTSRNIVGLLDVGWDSDPPYYVMEFLENGSLANLLEDGALSSNEAVRIAKAILYALVHAHGSGILHCDLKPANVLLDPDFEPRLCDFGQSRLSDEQNPALGTLFYMAPEQADLRAVPDARWDVYALGALMYQMLTGEAPFRTPANERRIREAKTLEDKLTEYRRILRSSPKPALKGVDRRLAEIVERCLKMDPEKRYPNAQAVLESLEQRDRHRARRPVLILSVFFPIILLLLLSPMAMNARNQAVDTATETLKQRAIESDMLSANILSEAVLRELQSRTYQLEKLANSHSLSAHAREDSPDDPNEFLIKLNESRKKLAETYEPEFVRSLSADKLKEARQKILRARAKALYGELRDAKAENDERRKAERLSKDTSWFVCDARGNQLIRFPIDIGTIDKNWNYRDYFHGHNREYKKGETPADLKPINKPHLSLAFRSKATKRFMVAISVPIRDDKGEVVGILARTMELGDLIGDYSAGLRSNREGLRSRTVALVENLDGKLLDHPWMNRENVEELEQTDRDLKMLSLSEGLQKEMIAAQKRIRRRVQSSATTGKSPRLAGDNRNGTENFYREDYIDPVGQLDLESANPYRGEWLAAFAPVGDTGWTVIVQERKSLAVEPIDEMESGLINSGKWALVIFIVLIVSVWAFLAWRVNDGRTRDTRRNGNSRPNNLSTASTRTSTPR